MTPSRDSRWLNLFAATRLMGAAVGAALLVGHSVTPGLPLAAGGLFYGAVTVIAAARWRPARTRLEVWTVDTVIVLTLVLAAGEWRSPFYLLALSALVLPATTLPPRRTAAFGGSFVTGYFAVALATGIDWSGLGATTRLESFTTHLLTPVLVTVALAYAAQLLARLERERERTGRLAVEAERNRIARELHDSAKQRVHAAHLVLSSAERHLAGSPAAIAVNHAMSELRAATADMEASLSELRTALEGRGLGEAVRTRARELEAAGTPIEVVGEPPEVPTHLAVHAFRVASEAMTNAVRHAGAAKVAVRLESAGDQLDMTVTDDGSGIPARRRPGSHGLSSMSARAERVGGRLTIGPGPEGKGTAVRLLAPLAPPPPSG